MRVLFLMFAFPDLRRSFNMYTAIVEQFHFHGHDTYVVAPETGGRATGIYKEKNIDVLRVRTLPIKNVLNVAKGISNILLPFQYLRALNRFYRDVKFDLIVIPTPPVTLVDLALKLKVRHQAKIYLMLRDIFPQNAVDLAFIKKRGLLHRYFRKKEIMLYRAADYIGCMSKANSEYILANNPFVPKRKLHILRNFQRLYQCTHGEGCRAIRDKYGLEGKFVVVFGGNMGKAQQLENVLLLAKACEDYSDVVFLFLGDGLHKKRLTTTIQKNAIGNALVLSTIAKSEYQSLLETCQLGLISLHENFTIPNIPSKTLDYFNVGIAVLASVDRATDYGQILDEAQAGLWSFSGDHLALKRNFDLLYSNRNLRKKMGRNGRKYFEQYLTPDKAYSVIMQHVI